MSEKVNIKFYAAECMEFKTLGATWEYNTVSAALKRYENIPEYKRSMCPGIGVLIKDADTASTLFDMPLYESGLVWDPVPYLDDDLKICGEKIEKAVQEMEKAFGKERFILDNHRKSRSR